MTRYILAASTALSSILALASPGAAQAPLETTIVIDGDRISYVGPSSAAPKPANGDTVVDYGDDFVLPGLIDIHVHLSYGNAQANEDVDMYAPPEFRALRAMAASQKVLKAGYTSMADPAR